MKDNIKIYHNFKEYTYIILFYLIYATILKIFLPLRIKQKKKKIYIILFCKITIQKILKIFLNNKYNH